jgi:hypothetical protein
MVAASVMNIGIDEEMVGVAPEVKDRLAAYFVDVRRGCCGLSSAGLLSTTRVG